MTWMLRNSSGKPDAVLTMTLVGFVVVLVKFALSGVTLAGFTFGDVDAATVAAILSPTLGAYIARRYTDRRFDAYAQPSFPDPTDADGGYVP